MDSLKLILQNVRYFSSVWVFASINILLGTWVLYLPYIKEKLILDDAELGIALFCYAFGILVMIPIVPIINRKLGVGRYTIFGITLFAISFLFPIYAPNYVWLCMSLFVVGAFSGSTDVTMNALVSEIERTDSVNFMSAAHGFFSVGGVIGAGVGSFFLLDVLSPKVHMFTVSIFIMITNFLLAGNYYKIVEAEVEKEKSQYKFSKFMPLAIIAFIAFAIMGSEGAIENWSKIYLLEVINVSSEKVAGYGFILFSATMTLGRFFGDGISKRFGSDMIIVGGSLIAVIAFVAILSGNLYVSLLGFGLLGIGLSAIVPELIRIAGKTKGVSSSAGIAFVSGIGFLGFLIGPVALGFISKFFGLYSSFVALLFLAIVASALGILRKVRSNS